MKQQARKNKHENRRRILQDDRVGRCGEPIRRDKGGDCRCVAEHGNEQRFAYRPIFSLNQEKKEKRGEEASVEDNRQRMKLERFDENSRKTP